ncbi:hypothetical protein ACF06Q_17890 [Streptomyces leeuwenhoekii]|uniref:hypothetical protein n=1 Tax=Streptomyces leeuwenhoekii TaxID=1437453 RepID=UPI0037018277
MRPTSLLKPVVAAAFGCLVLSLSGCGTERAATGRAPATSAAPAVEPLGAGAGTGDPEGRFLELLDRVVRSCDPDAPGGGGSGDVPAPEELPGWEGGAAPRYGPGEMPPGVPDAEGGIPVPPEVPAPPESSPVPTRSGPVGEVPLTDAEKCAGEAHARRVGEAFGGAEPTGHREIREELTGLDYPVSRIHRMPDRAGAPRVRLDLRFIGSRLVLEVTGTGGGVTVDVFGAPETEDVPVTDIVRKRGNGSAPSGAPSGGPGGGGTGGPSGAPTQQHMPPSPVPPTGVTTA